MLRILKLTLRAGAALLLAAALAGGCAAASARTLRQTAAENNGETDPERRAAFMAAGEEPTLELLIRLAGAGRLTRQEAALIAYGAMLRAGWQRPEQAGSLVMFADSLKVSPRAAEALAELTRIGVMPVDGAFLRPGAIITREEARALADGAAMALETPPDPLDALGQDRDALLGKLRCVASAMVQQGRSRFEWEPDDLLATLTVQLAAFSGLLDPELCRVANGTASLETGRLDEACALIFAGGALRSPNPAACAVAPRVEDGVAVFTEDSGDTVTIAPGAVSATEEGFLVWLTVYDGGVQLCTAVAELARGAVASMTFTYG